MSLIPAIRSDKTNVFIVDKLKPIKLRDVFKRTLSSVKSEKAGCRKKLNPLQAERFLHRREITF